MWALDKGRFTKQFFINFPDGVEFYGWIFLKENNKVTSGYRLKYPDGQKNFYTLGKDLDFKDLSELENGLAQVAKMIANEAKVEVHTLEFPDEMTVEEQLQKMTDMGLAGMYSKEEWEELNKKEEMRREEIKKLDLLWNEGEKKMTEENISSISWLCDCIEKWVNANNEKNKIVEFFGSFYIVNPEKDFEIEEDRLLAYGTKDSLLIGLKEMVKAIKKEKEDFVNW